MENYVEETLLRSLEFRQNVAYNLTSGQKDWKINKIYISEHIYTEPKSAYKIQLRKPYRLQGNMLPLYNISEVNKTMYVKLL